MLRAAELSWADTSQLTLSFAADGTDIAGEPSQLHAMFDSIARRSQWQSAVLNGFQTWAEQTGSNVGVVPEHEPLPFGVLGPRTGDTRFGDIRLGARPLASNVMAIAVAHDTIVSGTWSGDVIFNSNATFDGLGEVYTVALHEAGHVFGLKNNDDPNSPMNDQAGSLTPTAEDIADVQRLHGQRTADQNEGLHGNDNWRTATPLELRVAPHAGNLVASTHLVYGDITHAKDVDVFSLAVPATADGRVRVRLQTRRVSLLAPSLRVTNAAGAELASTQSNRVGGGTVEILIDDVQPEATYFLEVAAADDTRFDVGGYSLITAFDVSMDVPTDEAVISDLATLKIREFTQQQLQDMLADREYKIDGRENITDDILTAVNLPPDGGFELYSRYEAIGTITSGRDVDFFSFSAAPITDQAKPYLNLSVRSLRLGALIPEVSILDQFGNDIRAELLVNGGGEVVVQAPVATGANYYIRVRAANRDGLFDAGNYRVSLTFVETPVDTSTFAQGRIETDSSTIPSGMITPTTSVENADRVVSIDGVTDNDTAADDDTTADEHGFVLYVATPQLFHFILFAAPNAFGGRDAVLATIFDDSDQLVHSMSATSGDARTTNGLLLMPGTYTMRFDRISLPIDGLVDSDMRFRLDGIVVSDPFGTDPDDPTSDPFFECPDDDSVYCYPGEIVSEDPFLWDDFLETLPDLPDLDTAELVALLLGDWWAWYWQQNSSYTPPLAVEDTYAVPIDNVLVVHEPQGVLHNDVFDPFFSESIALIVDNVEHGNLSFEEDGSFTYIPAPGYQGTVTFSYEAFDFRQNSTIGIVSIAVGSAGIPGDFSGDGRTDIDDVDLLCAAIRDNDSNPVYDLDMNGSTDQHDLEIMIEEFLGTKPGDANLDGRFDTEDLVSVFIENEYEDGIAANSTWATGDWNCDGEFTSDDLIAAFIAGGYQPPAAAANLTEGNERSNILSDVAMATWYDDDRRKAAYRA